MYASQILISLFSISFHFYTIFVNSTTVLQETGGTDCGFFVCRYVLVVFQLRDCEFIPSDLEQLFAFAVSTNA